jgi:hypothetical protein
MLTVLTEEDNNFIRENFIDDFFDITDNVTDIISTSDMFRRLKNLYWAGCRVHVMYEGYFCYCFALTKWLRSNGFNIVKINGKLYVTNIKRRE